MAGYKFYPKLALVNVLTVFLQARDFVKLLYDLDTKMHMLGHKL